jgi:hypothetical protein
VNHKSNSRKQNKDKVYDVGVTCSFRGGVYPNTLHSAVVVSDGEGSKLHETQFGPKKMDFQDTSRIEKINFVLPLPSQISDDAHVQVCANGIFLEWFPINHNTLFGTIVRKSSYAPFMKSGHTINAHEFIGKVIGK